MNFETEAGGSTLGIDCLKNSGNAVLNSHGYGYNSGNQRTALTNTAGNYLNYGYDPLGQLKTALGSESNGTVRAHEQLGYAYDPANNLKYRTNNALVQSFTVNNLNELWTNSRSGTLTVAGTTTSAATNVTVADNGNSAVAAVRYTNDNTFARTNVTLLDGTNSFTAVAADSYGRGDTNVSPAFLPATQTFQYDLNGNLRSDGLRAFDYDDENQLIRVTVTNVFKSEFIYDGKMRRRIRQEYLWRTGRWSFQSETRYIYDGNLVIQERDALNLPTAAYTRGKDLSGSLEGAGGIGGLLALSDLRSSISNPSHYFYHADGNGNVAMLINSAQAVAAKYLYDPFGNVLSEIGPVAEMNLYRFSSKEAHPASGLDYFGYRYYDPNLQRWLNRDPEAEEGGFNLYRFTSNDPRNNVDAFGLCEWPDPQTCFDNCWTKAQQDMIHALGHATKHHAVGLVVGAVIAGTGAYVGTHGQPLPGVVVGGVGVVIELYEVGKIIDDLKKIKNGIRGDFAKCLLDCKRQFPGSEDDPLDYWNDHKIK